MNARAWIVVGLALYSIALCSSAFAAPKPLEAKALQIQHLETLRVGPYTLNVGFSEFPMRAERSADITFDPDGGIVGKTGSFKFFTPKAQIYAEDSFLPRFPRNRTVWGFDSLALPEQGTWVLEITVKGSDGAHTARLPIEVGARPAGPPSTLIMALATLPILALVFLAARSWRRVRPLRHAESRAW
jgi:hypothetical protein